MLLAGRASTQGRPPPRGPGEPGLGLVRSHHDTSTPLVLRLLDLRSPRPRANPWSAASVRTEDLRNVLGEPSAVVPVRPTDLPGRIRLPRGTHPADPLEALARGRSLRGPSPTRRTRRSSSARSPRSGSPRTARSSPRVVLRRSLASATCVLRSRCCHAPRGRVSAPIGSQPTGREAVLRALSPSRSGVPVRGSEVRPKPGTRGPTAWGLGSRAVRCRSLRLSRRDESLPSMPMPPVSPPSARPSAHRSSRSVRSDASKTRVSPDPLTSARPWAGPPSPGHRAIRPCVTSSVCSTLGRAPASTGVAPGSKVSRRRGDPPCSLPSRVLHEVPGRRHPKVEPPSVGRACRPL